MDFEFVSHRLAAKSVSENTDIDTWLMNYFTMFLLVLIARTKLKVSDFLYKMHFRSAFPFRLSVK